MDILAIGLLGASGGYIARRYPSYGFIIGMIVMAVAVNILR